VLALLRWAPSVAFLPKSLIPSNTRTTDTKLALSTVQQTEAQIPETDKTEGGAEVSLPQHELFSTLRPPTEEEVNVIQHRQEMRRVNALGVAKNCRCRHGFPQAYASEFRVKRSGKGPPVYYSGLQRLTCPWLVGAIDQWEAEGAVKALSAELGERPEWQEDYARVNDEFRQMRYILSDNGTAYEEMKVHWGEAAAENMQQSGLASVTNNEDVKCLHAQAADFLLRGQNQIGAEVLRRLDEAGISSSGSASCWQQCDLGHVPDETSFSYTSIKNKSKLRTRLVQRNLMRAKRQKKKRRAEALRDSEVRNPSTPKLASSAPI